MTTFVLTLTALIPLVLITIFALTAVFHRRQRHRRRALHVLLILTAYRRKAGSPPNHRDFV